MRPFLEYGSSVGDPYCNGLNGGLENVQNRTARFVTRKYSRETSSLTGILEELKVIYKGFLKSFLILYAGKKLQVIIMLKTA